MKRNSKKLLTLLLAGALCAATVGGVSVMASAAETTAKTYAFTDVFTMRNDAEVTADQTKTKITFKKDSEVELKRDLALKWFDKNGAKYFNFAFAFADNDYQSVSFVVESAPYQSVEGGIAVNTIKFEKAASGVDVKVFAGSDEESATAVNVALSGDVTVALDAGSTEGEFAVKVNGATVGAFTNVGANYAERGYEGEDDEVVESLVMKATPVENKTTAIHLKNLNGQSFDKLVDGKIADDAAPVLIVNQEVSHFLLGTEIKFEDANYVGVDVLKSDIKISTSSSADGSKKYYQYNPADTEVKGIDVTTTMCFMDSVYYVNAAGDDFSKEEKDGYTLTSVWRENEKAKGYGEEYVSIWFDLGDDTFKTAVDSETETEYKKARYELAWYAKDTVTIEGKDYIVLNRNEEGPKYVGITANDTTKKNDVSISETAKDGFASAINKKAADVYAGSNAELEIPAVKWLIDDNNGYQSLSFTISYKTPTSTSATTVSAAYNKLKIPTKTEGMYEFKIFATDVAGNTMKYYLDGELVDVSNSTVWDIDEIPTFQFEVANKGIKTKDNADSDTLDSKTIGESCSMSAVSIVGANGDPSSAYKLYRIKEEWNVSGVDLAKLLSRATFAELNKEADDLVEADNKTFLTSDEYMEYYVIAFRNLMNENKDENDTTDYTTIAVEDIFEEIALYDSTLDEDEGANIYNWSATSRRFTAAEEGLYLIMADYWDSDLPNIDRVPAYRLFEVEDKEDTIPGVSEWLANNMVSIILFSVAGVLAIAIVVLLFVKPSDETLADVDKKAAKKNSKK